MAISEAGPPEAQLASQSQRDTNTPPSAMAGNTTDDGEMIRNPEAKKFAEEAAALRIAKREETEALKAELAQLKAEAEERRRKELGEIDRLKEDHAKAQALAEENQRFKQAFEESLSRRIEAIPEEERRRIPEFEDPRKTAQWLDDNQDLFESRAQVPNTDAGASGDKRPAMRELTQEQLDMARRAGMTPEQYATMLDAAGKPISRK